MSARVELYKAPGKKADRMDWYWRFIKNGNVMADAGGYSRRIDCVSGCATVLNGRVIGAWVIRGFGADREQIPVHDLTRRATAAGRAS